MAEPTSVTKPPFRLPRAPMLAGALVYVWVVSGHWVDVAGTRYWVLQDDAMISMRYAQTLAHGGGLAWNASGPRIQGFTNLGWTLVMAAIDVLPVSTRWAALIVMAIGFVVLLATVAVASRVAYMVTSEGPSLSVPLAAWLVALSYPLIFWTLGGMETGLIALLLLLGVLFALRWRDEGVSRDLYCVAAVGMVAVVVRTDAALPVLLTAAFAVAWSPASKRVRTMAVLGGSLIVPIVAVEVFQLAYYGHPFPNTYYLKVSGHTLSTRLGRGLRDLAADGVARLGFALLLAGGYVLMFLRRAHAGAVLLLALFIGQASYAVYVGGDTYDGTEGGSRFLAVALPGLLIVAAVAVGEWRRIDRPRLLRSVVPVLMGLGGLAVLRLMDVQPGRNSRFGSSSLPNRWALGAPVMVAVAIGIVVALRSSDRSRRTDAGLALLCGALIVMGISGNEADEHVRYETSVVTIERPLARLATGLRAATDERARIATSIAGGTSYFSDRTMIDILGYNDDVIASRPPHPLFFVPGHDKWDVAYSIGLLRPDLVALTYPVILPALQAQIRSYGYEQIGTEVYVRNDTQLVDRDGVRRAIRDAGFAVIG